ncbi:MAG: hypothetical protein HOV80_21815, partial [Polyangiaceae bacterium]|nr:hypothetical protein [Polyangiaceae bacterium]
MATSRAGVSGAQDKEAAPRLAEQLEAIELALKGLHACGRAVVMAPRSTLDLRPAARAAERAVAGALEAYDGRRDVVAALCDAVAATEELENELGRSATVDPGL